MTLARRNVGSLREAGTPEEMRRRALIAPPEELGIVLPSNQSEVWGLIADIGFSAAAATIVAFADGQAAMYFSKGGGVFGGGSRQTVRMAARAAIAAIQATRRSLFRASSGQDLPAPGNLRLYARTSKGLFCSDEVSAAAVSSGDHPLSPSYAAVNAIVTQLRRSTEKLA